MTNEKIFKPIETFLFQLIRLGNFNFFFSVDPKNKKLPTKALLDQKLQKLNTESTKQTKLT